MKIEFISSILQIFTKKPRSPKNKDTTLANMLVDHINNAGNRPTAIVKNGNRGY